MASIGPRLKTFEGHEGLGTKPPHRREPFYARRDHVPGRRWKALSRDIITAWGMTKLMSKTVLHADDSASVRRWVAEQLGDMDLKVISVADGEAALKVLQEAPCDLLLTDLEMPNLDGLSLVSESSRPADASFLAGSHPVVPAAHRIPAGEPARCDGLADQRRSNRTNCGGGFGGFCHVDRRIRIILRGIEKWNSLRSRWKRQYQSRHDGGPAESES